MRAKQGAIISTVLAAIVLVLLAFNSIRYFARIDITRHRENSISAVSQRLFTEVEETVQITYAVSTRLRTRAYQPDQIIDLLQEYAAFARGRIRLEVVDPVEAGIVSEIEQLGIVPQQIQVIEQDQQSLAVVYTGVVIRYLDQYRTLPVVFDPGTIEYQVTAAITDMVRGTERSVGLLVGASNSTVDNSFRLLAQALSQRYEVQVLDPGADIAPSLRAVLVLGADALTVPDLDPIDRYLSNGGSVLFAVDGVHVDFERGLAATPLNDRPIMQLLAHYGFEVEPALVLNRTNLRIPMQQQMGAYAIQTLEPYAHWIPIPPAAVNRAHPITARFSGLDLYWASPVRLRDSVAGAALLVESPPDSWLMREPFYTNPSERFLFENGFTATRGVYDFAFGYVGPVDSWVTMRAGNTSDATTQARVVVVGDSDFLSDLLRFSGSEHNLEFALNAVEWLTNDEDLLAIRTRATRDLRLNRIPDRDLFSLRARWAEVVNVFLMPLSVVIVGVVAAMRRKGRAAR